MTRRSKEQWQQIIADQTSSGLSAAAYCREHDLNQQYFSARKTQLRKNNFVRVSPSIDQPPEPVTAFTATVSKQPRIRIIDIELADADTQSLYNAGAGLVVRWLMSYLPCICIVRRLTFVRQ